MFFFKPEIWIIYEPEVDHLKTGKNSGASLISQWIKTLPKVASSKVEKFVCLRSLCKPPALTVIQGFALSVTSYETAMDLIKNRLKKMIL